MNAAAGHDVIVVGAGSAGCVIAARLTEDPSCRVLLLEAGGRDNSIFIRRPGMLSVIHTVPQVKAMFDWGYKSSPQPHILDRLMPQTRGKVIGGSSSINGMLFVRGNRANYDDWAADGCPGWGFDDVLPALKRLEDWEGDASDLRGKGGPIQVSRPPVDGMSPMSLAFLDAVSQAGGVPILDDYNGADQEGVARVQMSCRDGVRYSTAKGYLHDALARPNLTVVTGAHVHKVIVDNGRATGVRYDTGGDPVDVHASSEVVVAAGAMGSPHLLMLSGIGPAAHLAEHGLPVVADLPVGDNLHDHLFFPLTFLTPRGGHRGTPAHFFGGMFKEFLLGGTWFGRSVFETIAFLKTDPGQRIPNLQLHCLPWAYPRNQDDTSKRPEVDMRPALTIQPTLIYPASRGAVRLTSADPHARPHVDPAYLADPGDVDVLLRGIELTRAIMAHPSIAPEVTGELEPGPLATDTADKLLHELRYRCATVYHPVGTCRMGSDARAVVDPALRVRGVDRLTVADASVFPSITGGNTNVPSIMIGERAAELVRARL